MSSSHKEGVWRRLWSCLRSCRDWRHLLAKGLGTGCLPVFHGTWGTIPAVIIFWAIGGLPIWWLVGITAAIFLVGIPLTGWVARDMQSEDPGVIVWDEWAGYFVAALFTFTTPGGWGWLWIAFGLFRFFDMLKPIFVKEIEKRTKGGLGIMLDDVLGGVLAGFGILILQKFGVLGLTIYLFIMLFFYLGDVEEARKTVNRPKANLNTT